MSGITHEEFERLVARMSNPEMLEAMAAAAALGTALARFQNAIDRLKISDPERQAAIAVCATPSYHKTHRYCPSCPWTEADETELFPATENQALLRNNPAAHPKGGRG